MAPSGAALNHPAAPLLLELATIGCVTDMGKNWTLELIEAAIRRGAHPSALSPEAAAQLRDETLEKSIRDMLASSFGTTSNKIHHPISKYHQSLPSRTRAADGA
jgi:hypothetical protein